MNPFESALYMRGSGDYSEILGSPNLRFFFIFLAFSFHDSFTLFSSHNFSDFNFLVSQPRKITIFSTSTLPPLASHHWTWPPEKKNNPKWELTLVKRLSWRVYFLEERLLLLPFWASHSCCVAPQLEILKTVHRER